MSGLQLVVVSGPDKGQRFPLQEGTGQILGRHQDAAYKLTDPRMSRQHCEVHCEGDQVKLLDRGSTGGTFVNGQKISERSLKPGDIIKIGESELRLEVGDIAGASTLTSLGPRADEDARATEQLAELRGRTLAHYQISDALGKGTSAMVFRATDTNDGKTVALKVMHPSFSQDEEEMQRFVRAMKTMLPLQHPHLVRLYGAGKSGPYCWMAMELVEGENMTQVIQRIGVAGMLDWKYAYRVAVHIGRALEYAHGQNIIHRNITPANILLEKETKMVKLGDLMLARALEGTLARQITKPGELLGDVNYLSPERTRSQNTATDGRSDLFSLGAAVYALLTGKPPFAGTNVVETISKIRTSDPEKPTKFQLSIPGLFEGVVLKLLAKAPEQRYQTATELLQELERIGRFQGATA
jgi:serine/threonine protein kinase